MSYEPRPDTHAFRALAHMELLHKGSEIPNALLAQAIDCPATTLPSSLQPALEAGLIFCRQKGGHSRSPLFWSLVDQAKKEYTPERGSQHVLKAEAGRASQPDATDRETPAMQRPSVGSMGTGQPADAGARRIHEIDIDAVHRTHDNVIEMETPPLARAQAAPMCEHGGPLDGDCRECAAAIAADRVDHFHRITIDDALLLPTSQVEKTHKPAIALVTLSIQCTPHQAERVTAFLASMREVAA